MNATLILAAKKKKALALREQRPCTLLWQGAQSVLAREGITTLEQDLAAGGFVERRSCKFFVLKELLAVAPAIDTLFSLQSRPEVWRLVKVRGGGANDVEWIFECMEEHR